jgi:acyl dehydratase
MSLNHDIVGVDSEPAERTWTETDVLLYALAVGAGQEDPLAELEFTTENSAGVQLQVLPTFGNPLHSDPEFAARGGFSRPILHGMCTYGYTGRALLHAVCGSDPARFKAMEGRFTRPVIPGDQLTIDIWSGGGSDGNTAYFRTASNGVPVLDKGRLTFTS